MPEPAAPDARWAAVLARDPAVDGAFLYGVASTGVYCRPSCAARTPKRSGVSFHADRFAAETAGFRPCKRCTPDGPSLAERRAEMATAACRTIEAAETPPLLSTLAEAAGISPHHFHRLFRAVTGLTPRAYGAAHRARRAREALQAGGTVTEVLLEAGFNTPSRFYEETPAMLGMTPGAYRAGGAATVIRFAVGQSSLGAILVASSEVGVCAILLGEDPEVLARDLQDRFPRAELVGGDADYEATVSRVVGWVEAPGLGADLPLDIRGTAFQQRVWRALREIPPGRTASYAEVAQRIGAPRAVRAVAGACAANSLAVAIPCHRVVRTDGGLSGYRWGVERKRDLLRREAGEA